MACGAFYMNRQSSPPVPQNSMINIEDVYMTEVDKVILFYYITLF